MDHSPYICSIIGILWALSGAFGLFSYISYDQNRLSVDAMKLYLRFLLSVGLFGLATATFLIHAVIHP